MPAGYLFIYEA